MRNFLCKYVISLYCAMVGTMFFVGSVFFMADDNAQWPVYFTFGGLFLGTAIGWALGINHTSEEDEKI